jgi:sulfide:quinone oxidoreductase
MSEQTHHAGGYSAGKCLRVLIAGGGVAALEAVLALRSLAPDEVAVTVLSGSDEFVYQPLTVLEPFKRHAAMRLAWSRVATELGAAHILGRLDAVDPDARQVTSEEQGQIDYDLLVVAIGGRRRDLVSGALTVGSPGADQAFAALLKDRRAGRPMRLSFISPAGVAWSIAIYELALLTAELVNRHGSGAELSLITAEREPLEVLGSEAARRIAALLALAGVELECGRRVSGFEDGRLQIDDGGTRAVDAAIALPAIIGRTLPGVPRNRDDFIVVDEYGLVRGEDCIYAVGDVTDFAIKQGGIATQQADAAASQIAARAGADVIPAPFDPVLRAAVLTGRGSPLYIRRELAQGGDTVVADEPPWWPPAKIAGRYVAPFLARWAEDAESRLSR